MTHFHLTTFFGHLENHSEDEGKTRVHDSTAWESSSNQVTSDQNLQEYSGNKLSYNNEPIYYSCNKIECEAGGTCVYHENYHDKRVRCRCPLGRGGIFCEKCKLEESLKKNVKV